MAKANQAKLAPAGSAVDWPWRISLILAVLGMLVSAYLTWVKLSNTLAFCSGVGDCEAVNSSSYSAVFGVPVAVLGLLAYLGIAAVLAAEKRLQGLREYGPLAVFGLALTGTLYSAYLTYVELFIIHAVCPYCVASALIITTILILSILRLVRGLVGGEDAR
ncbi:MAG: vitamin K epoxide reductase family protein [Anaerolineales bacterium]